MVLIPIFWLFWLSLDRQADFPPSATLKLFSEPNAPPKGSSNMSWEISALRPGVPGQVVDAARQEVLASIFQMRKIPVNLVDVELLQTVPGIGSELAARIVEERRIHGPYKNSEDLMRVTGIGTGRSQQFKQVLRFD